MKWFRKWMLDSLRRASAEESQMSVDRDYDEPVAMGSGLPFSNKKYRNSVAAKRQLVVPGSDIDLPDGGLNIQVKGAIGGKIVIFRSYDDRTDRNCYSTYLIPDSENFQESLGKIITMESLKL